MTYTYLKKRGGSRNSNGLSKPMEDQSNLRWLEKTQVGLKRPNLINKG